jgi:hypothetical protein
MVKLDSGNVLLKPSHRRQLMSWLKRAMRFVQRMGDLAISISMHRIGRLIEIRADVADGHGGAISFRSRQHEWSSAARELVRRLTSHLHDQMVHQLPA